MVSKASEDLPEPETPGELIVRYRDGEVLQVMKTRAFDNDLSELAWT